MNEAEDVSAELVIAGEGPHREVIELVVEEVCNEDSVHVVGYIERDFVYKMLHEIDCLVMPSRWEGHSAAVLQAMAAGVPCVLSEIPSFESQYSDDVVVFHDVNSPSDLARAIQDVITSKENLGDRGYEYVRPHYTVERMAKQYAEVFRDISNSNDHPKP